jgi:hypothetical protein
MLRLHELQRERYPGRAGADDAQITFQLRMSRNRLRVRYHLGSARRRISLSRRTRVRAQIRATKIAGSPRQNDKAAPPAGALEGRRGESPRASQSRPTSFNRHTIHGRHLHLAQNSHTVRNAIMHEKECKVGAADPGGPRLLFTVTSRNHQSATLDFPARGVFQRGVTHENQRDHVARI